MAQLKRLIGKKTLLILTINSILGSSIFFLPAIAAGYSGPDSIIAWILMAVVAVVISTYFAELVSKYPKAGGIYEYAKHSIGQSSAFFVGWVSWIVANIAIALEIVGSLLYLLPGYSLFVYALLSFAFIASFNYISYRGIDYSSKMLLIFGGITLFSLLAIIVPGSFAINPGNLALVAMPLPLIFLSIYFVSDTFFGWESATYLSEEVKNARKVMPRIIVLSTVIVSLLCIALPVISLGVVDWRTLGSNPASLTLVAETIFGTAGGRIFSVLIFVLIMGSAASWMVASPRLLYAMARDKVLVPRFAKIHSKYRTPHNAIFFQTIIISLVTIIGFADYVTLLTLILPLEMLMYSVMLVVIIKMRMNNIRSGYKSIFGLHGALGVIVLNAFLVYVWIQQPGALSIFAMSVMLGLLGFPLYLLMKLSTDKRFIEKFFDRISWLWDMLFPVWYAGKEIRNVTNKLKIGKGFVVLDFGCGSGITTLELAKKVGGDGTIVAVDISEKQLKKAFAKIENAMKISNVVFIKESQLTFEPDYFDAVTAVGVLEHMDNPEETLGRLFKNLRKGGTFSFLSFGKSFGIPAPEFLGSKKKVEELFRKLGVKAKVRIEKKKFTEYVYIWGKK
ncbi:MAG: amino acid permease [Candidatus Aenigmarchaeota archaeon]|nr:amino acid permease [Candidatus Aenigmarchaeota archaeon]